MWTLSSRLSRLSKAFLPYSEKIAISINAILLACVGGHVSIYVTWGGNRQVMNFFILVWGWGWLYNLGINYE